MEGLEFAEKFLPLGINVCAFDFSGSGNSEGEYVTHGYQEKDDLKSVIRHLRAYWNVSEIAIWGRGIGAAAAIRYMRENPNKIACVVLDSPYNKLVDHIYTIL